MRSQYKNGLAGTTERTDENGPFEPVRLAIVDDVVDGERCMRHHGLWIAEERKRKNRGRA
jgi:hypothetical protein